MFQRKLKSRLLRPLLLLAAVLALSQTASAWTYYYLRSSGGNNSANLRYELIFNEDDSNPEYVIDNVVIASNGDFKITCTDSQNSDTNWYGPVNATTVDKTVSSNLQYYSSDTGNNFYVTAGTYSVKVKVPSKGNNPSSVTFTKKGSSEGGEEGNTDMPVSELDKFWMRGNWGSNDYGWTSEGQVMFNADGTVSIVKSANNFQCKVGWGATVQGNTGGWIQPKDMVLSSKISKSGSGDETNLTVPTCPVGKTMIFTLSFDGNTPHLDVTWDGVVDYDPTKFNGGEVLFVEVKTDNGWLGSNATFWAEFVDGSTTKKVQFIQVDGTNYYRLTVPEGKWPSLNLLRCNLNGTGDNGNPYWNHVDNITPPENRDNNCILKWRAEDDNNGQWNSGYGWQQINVSTVSGMPFYPVGITNERDFKALPSDKRFYYLAGHNINAGKVSPEWQLIETGEGTGVYTLDFTYNHHTSDGVGGDCSNTGDANKLRIQYYTPASDSDETVEGADNLTPPALRSGWERAGVRMRVTFTESTGTVKFDYLAYDGTDANGKAKWRVVTDKADATYLPFISLVADGWSQPVTSDIYVANESGSSIQRPENWQNAWIQYDENGDIVYSRDNNAVYYNTQWPPVHSVYIEKSYTLNGKTRDLTMDSDNLSFAYTGVSKTGSQWKNEKSYSKIEFNTSHGVAAAKKAATTYRQYVVEDIWATGRFKIWSGWSGARFGSGTAEWSKNWNWGQEDEGASDAHPYVVNVDSPTVFLGNQNGDLMFGKVENETEIYEPTYFKRVTFFMAVDEEGGVIANDKGRSFLYFEPSYANLRIQSLNNEDYSAGTFLPQIDPDLIPGQKITRVQLNLYRSSDDTQVATLWNEINQNIEPSQFTQAFAANPRFTASDYNDDYYNDGFRYQAAGYYYYTLTVTFKDGTTETVETARSNPFFVAVAPATLITSQLVEIVRGEDGKAVEERFNDYQYVTYTPGTTYEWGYLTDEAYAERKANWSNYPGRDATGLGRYGYRIEKINMNPSSQTTRAFYADADKARWTSKVLIFALRPWKGETPSQVLAEQGAHGAYWSISYNAHRNHGNWDADEVSNPDRVYFYGKVNAGATDARQSDAGDFLEGAVESVDDLAGLDYDAPLEWIKEGVCIYEHEFKCQLHYYVSAEENKLISTSDESTDHMQLRIPTPRMRPDLFSATMEDRSQEGVNYGTITIAADKHTGNVTDEIAYEDHDYDNPRVRTIRFGAYMDMPNATPELISLIPDTGAPATEAEEACGKMGNYWRECEIDCGEDVRFEQLFSGTWLNIKDMRRTRFRFLNQDPNYWLKYNAETNQYDPVERHITFDFDYDHSGNGEILFFPSQAGGVTFSLKSLLAAPEFVKDEQTENVKAMVYSVIVPKKGESNKYEERLILANVATGLGTESYLELPGEDNPDEPVQIPFAVNTDKAYYMLRIGGKLPEVRHEEDGPWVTQNYFAHHNDINSGSALYTVKCVDRGSWWDGMGDFSMVKEDFDIEIAHAHIFYVNRDIDFQHMHTDGKWTAGGAVSKTPDIPTDAPRRAPRRAPGDDADMDEHYVGFTGPTAKATISASNIMTGVATVTAAQSIISGKGFIDLNGNEGIVYSTDATLVYQGNGRTAVSAGIYLVKTAGETYKIAVQ